MSEQLIKEDVQLDEISDEHQQKERKTKYIIIGGIIFAIIIVVIIVFLLKKSNHEEEEDIKFDISTVNFPSDVKYIGSHYTYQNNIFLIYQNKTIQDPDLYFIAIANEEGKILKIIREIKKEEVADVTYIHRASSFSDGKRVFIGGKIVECTKEFLQCDDAKIIDVKFPDELEHMKKLLYLFTEPIVNYEGKHLFWSTFDTDMNIMNFVGELVRKDNKYVIENTQGLSNFFYDLYDKENNTYYLGNIIRTGPIKQVVNGGVGLSIGGFLNYGTRKGIYQSLSNDTLEQLTYYNGYDETTAISPDGNLACVMTSRFSKHTSMDILGMIPTPYSIVVSYWLSGHLMKYTIANLRVKENIKGNIGPALMEMKKIKEDKNYLGKLLNDDEKWVFYGFISWAPDGKKIMFDETDKGLKNRRCRIVKLTNYKPGKIEFKNNFNGNVPYARTINETINLHLDYPININKKGKQGNFSIFQNENISKIEYNNYTEDNEIFYNGIYSYEKFLDKKYTIYRVNITSYGKKNGYCNYRLWFDTNTNEFSFDYDGYKYNKTYGDCEYDGKKLDVNVYIYEKFK